MYYNLKYCISQMIYQGFYILTLKNVYVVISLLLFNLLGVWRYVHCFDQLIHSGRQKFFRLQNWTSFFNICQFPSRQPCFYKAKIQMLVNNSKTCRIIEVSNLKREYLLNSDTNLFKVEQNRNYKVRVTKYLPYWENKLSEICNT